MGWKSGVQAAMHLLYLRGAQGTLQKKEGLSRIFRELELVVLSCTLT